MKFCECGCGGVAPIADRSYWKWGHIKGKPMRFIRGHAMKGKTHTLVAREKIRKNSPTTFKKGHKPLTDGANLLVYQKRENHWNWKGGITPEVIRVRGSKECREWRERIFERDNYTCQFCGKRGGRLEADHYPVMFSQIFREKNWELLKDISNGRTLCRPCHDGTKTGNQRTI